METIKRDARIAGFLYLLLVIVGPYRLIYVPGVVLVRGDAVATANNIAAHETVVRLGILADLVGSTIGLFVTLALYRLFERVDRGLALLMVILGGLMVTPIYFVNTINDAAALLLVTRPEIAASFGANERAGLATLFFRLHHAGEVANEIFWGLWLLPFGVLVYRSRFLPRFLGAWLIVNGLAYVVLSFTGVLAPQREAAVFNVASPIMLGEIAITLWLLIVGARPPRAAPAVP